MRAATTSSVQEIRSAIEAPDGTGPKLVDIHGITDTADRAEHFVMLKPSEIEGLSLTQLRHPE